MNLNYFKTDTDTLSAYTNKYKDNVTFVICSADNCNFVKSN